MAEPPPLNIATQTLQSALSPTTATPLNIPLPIISLPEQLLNIIRPLTINGTIANEALTNFLFLKTNFGDIQLSLAKIPAETLKTLTDLLAKTQGARSLSLDIILQPGDPPKQAIIVSAKPVLQPQAPSQTSSIQPPVPSPQPQGEIVPKQTAPTLKVTVLPQDFDNASVIGNPPSSDPATALKNERPMLPNFLAKILSQAEGKDKTSQIATKAVETPQQGQSQPAQTESKAALQLIEGKPYKITLNAVLSATADWPDQLPEGQVKATMLGTTAGGNALVKAEGKTLFVHDTLTGPAGTKMILTIAPQEAEPAALLQPMPDKDFLPAKEMVAAMFDAAPDAARNFLATRLPTPQQHMAGTALFILSALHGGKLDDWIGAPAIAALAKKGKQQLKDKLIETLKDLNATTATDTRVGDWKMYPIPIHYAGSFELLRLYVHKDKGENQNDPLRINQGEKTRFLISMNMSRLGYIQLDGLSQKKRLDLIVRSDQVLPENLISSLRQTTTASLEAVGLTGTLIFQHGRQNWITPQDTNAQHREVEM